jgi:hypothetical protein
MPVKINSSGGGSVTLSSGGIATDVTATFPATTGNAVVDTAVQTLTNKTLVGAVMTSMASSVLTLGTSQATTSGTSIDFTGLPSWVRRVTVILNGVSTNGASNLIVQLGSGSFVTTGYASQTSIASTNTGVVTTGIIVHQPAAASRPGAGHCVLTQVSANLWVASVVVGFTNLTLSSVVGGGTAPTLSGALDRIRLTTVNGTDAFNAGSINLLWE